MNELLDEPNEEENFVLPGKLSVIKYKIDLAEEKIYRTRFFLFLMSAFALFNLIRFIMNYGFEVLYEGHIIYLTLFIIYITCAFISIKKALWGISIALVSYILFQVGIYFYYGTSLISSPIGKGVTLFFLITGFIYCFKAMKMKKKLNQEISKLNII